MRFLLILITLFLLTCSREEKHYYNNGSIEYSIYPREVVINNFPIIGKVEYFQSGTLKSFSLGRGISTSLGIFPIGSIINLHSNGNIKSAYSKGKNIVIYSLEFSTSKNRPLYFYENSFALYEGFLAKDSIYSGIPVKASTSVPVRFMEDGRIISCKIYKDYIFMGINYQANSTVTFVRGY